LERVALDADADRPTAGRELVVESRASTRPDRCPDADAPTRRSPDVEGGNRDRRPGAPARSAAARGGSPPLAAGVPAPPVLRGSCAAGRSISPGRQPRPSEWPPAGSPGVAGEASLGGAPAERSRERGGRPGGRGGRAAPSISPRRPYR